MNDRDSSEPVRFPEHLDEDERVTALGLFHSAHSYAMSAIVLKKADISIIRSDDPIRFLYTHAIELYLKSFLRLKGVTVQQLRSREFGHRISVLRSKAQEFGLQLKHFEEEQLDLLDDGIRDRYPEIGFRTILSEDALWQLCSKLHLEFGRSIYTDRGITRAPVRFDLTISGNVSP